jgi:hypothetical protein
MGQSPTLALAIVFRRLPEWNEKKANWKAQVYPLL